MNLRVMNRKSSSTAQTMALMREMVAKYRLDMLPLARLPIGKAFRAIADVPYMKDRWLGQDAEVSTLR